MNLKTLRFKVKKVIDGDTIKGVFLLRPWWAFRDREIEDTIRFLGLNAPEMKGKEEDLAERAKVYVFNRLDGKTVHVTFAVRKYAGDWERGDFNRVLGLVRVHSWEPTINESLLRKGLARSFKLPVWTPAVVVKRFKSAEADAKKKRRGLWKETPRHTARKKGSRLWWWITAGVLLCLLALLSV